MFKLFMAFTLWAVLLLGFGTALGYWVGRLLLYKFAGF